MKKLIVLLLTLLCLCGCTSKEESFIGGDLESIKERGYLLVALEGTWAPWCYHNENDELVGFDVEVAKYIADYLGVDVKYVEGEFDGILEGVKVGRSDVVINGIDVTEKRKKTLEFSDAYAYDRIAIIVSSDNNDIKTLEDLNGKATANTSMSTYATIATDYGASVQPVDDLNETFLLLKTGRIDATINAEMSYLDYMKQHPDDPIKIACYYFEAPEIAVATNKNSTALIDEINKAIASGHEDGTIAKLSMKYFDTDITVKQ